MISTRPKVFVGSFCYFKTSKHLQTGTIKTDIRCKIPGIGGWKPWGRCDENHRLGLGRNLSIAKALAFRGGGFGPLWSSSSAYRECLETKWDGLGKGWGSGFYYFFGLFLGYIGWYFFSTGVFTGVLLAVNSAFKQAVFEKAFWVGER